MAKDIVWSIQTIGRSHIPCYGEQQGRPEDIPAIRRQGEGTCVLHQEAWVQASGDTGSEHAWIPRVDIRHRCGRRSQRR